jgi:methionyl-tRNA formyltransferase
VAQRADELGLEVVPVERVREPEFLSRIEAVRPWAAVVVAFGQIFPSRLLETPTVGCINLHASLLPSFRGAAPIQAAIAAGKTVTGITTMRMEADLDSGPILLQQEVVIEAGETAPELSRRLATIGSVLTVETLRGLAAGTVEPQEQAASAATYAPKLKKEDGRIDWRMKAEEIYNRWRAYSSWPGLSGSLHGRPLKVVDCRPVEDETSALSPGTLSAITPDLWVVCGEGTVLVVREVQRPGRRAVKAGEFAHGERLLPGQAFDADLPADPAAL